MAKLTTMFHGGKVRVYNAIPRNKAILLIATAANKTPAIVGPSAATSAAVLGPLLTRSLSLQSSTAGAPPQVELQAGEATHFLSLLLLIYCWLPTCDGLLGTQRGVLLIGLHAELPMARRQSLQLFLEKRRNR
ncbi:hypothetical protein BHE74_00038033 [Ensete ventricosum]|nr:hypothetical protein GW17_00002977 [Ensete ventricosum]RWW55338.1 hypothetical protein BHE74_00038033 [Ensete ventricosum]RZS04452.1 hypothetical protein BHM03_00034791 [Ensete ventricosum]